MANPVVHFEVTGKDMQKLKDFYQGVFDWDINVMPEMNYGMVAGGWDEHDGGSRYLIGGGIGAGQGEGHATFYIQVEDVDAHLKKIEASGGKTVMPPMNVSNTVSIALFQDPEGHVIGLVKERKMQNPVVHFEINGKDLQRLKDFYQNVFDWQVNIIPEMNYGLVESPVGGGIGGGIGVTEGAGSVTFYIEVDDLGAYLKKIEGRGGKTVTPPTEVPNVVTFATFEDPEGHLIGLVKR